jgi:hypothetical protein
LPVSRRYRLESNFPFYVRKGYRRKRRHGSVDHGSFDGAKRAKAPALEAYPLDADLTPSASGTGYASTCSRAGFKTVARRARLAR